MKLNAILLIYHHPQKINAPTILEYINAIPRYSHFPVLSINTEWGFPGILREYCFQGIILHYSLFGSWPYQLNKSYYQYLVECRKSFKLAIFQDEYRFCQPRFHFINEYGIDAVYTCIAPNETPQFYGKYCPQVKTKTVLTGYVSDDLLELLGEIAIPPTEREIDISYRGRPLPFYLGKGAQEKMEIAQDFMARADKLGFVLDIKTAEEDRVYGKDWYRFLANSRGVLGVESGVSFSDVDGRAYRVVKSYLDAHPHASFAEVYQRVLLPFEGHIPIRTISPRHFEAAALRVCQILFEGEYAGILKPMEHYLPLKKDFSNFEEIIHLFKDPEVCARLTENAYRDLIASGKYHYKNFVYELDQFLLQHGLKAGAHAEIADLAKHVLYSQGKIKKLKLYQGKLFQARFFQSCVKPLVRPILVRTGLIIEQ